MCSHPDTQDKKQKKNGWCCQSCCNKNFSNINKQDKLEFSSARGDFCLSVQNVIVSHQLCLLPLWRPARQTHSPGGFGMAVPLKSCVPLHLFIAQREMLADTTWIIVMGQKGIWRCQNIYYCWYMTPFLLEHHACARSSVIRFDQSFL